MENKKSIFVKALQGVTLEGRFSRCKFFFYVLSCHMAKICVRDEWMD